MCGHYFVQYCIKKSKFSNYSFGTLVFCLSLSSTVNLYRLCNICVIIIDVGAK